MKKLTPSELQYLQDLIASLKFEAGKAEKNGGHVAPSYIKEKCDKIIKLVK